MQSQRRSTSPTVTTRRSSRRENRAPGVMVTAISAGVVLLLLAATFLADAMRTPQLTITNAPPLLSPNGDNSFDSAAVQYQLSESAEVQAQVLTEGEMVIRTLMTSAQQTSGQHLVQWNGSDDAGRRVADGLYRILITAKGTLRSVTAATAVQVDTTPPMLQLVNLVEGARVKDALLSIEGITDPGATVLIDGVLEAVAVDGQGRFRSQKKLVEGTNRVEVRAADTAGNSTILARSIDLITAAPELTLTSPQENAWLKDPMVTVTGLAPLGATVQVNSQAVPLAPDGSFRYDVLLDEGQQNIVISATDDVGNISTIQRLVHVVTRAPVIELSVPDGVAFSDATLQLSGQTNAGAQVMVNRVPVAVGALGDFQTTLTLNPGDNAIEVSAIDLAGNQSVLTRHVRYIQPMEPAGIERLLDNVQVLPPYTLPAALAMVLALGFLLYRQNKLELLLSVDARPNGLAAAGSPQENKGFALRLELNHAAKVTLEVLDEWGNTQAILLDNRRRSARQHLFVWDGYDDFGRMVDPGIYTVRATAGASPMKVSSAVQVEFNQVELPAQMALPSQPSEPQRVLQSYNNVGISSGTMGGMRRRVRPRQQNRKR